MAQTQIVPESAAQLIEHWRSQLDAMHSAGDTEALQREKSAHSEAAVNLLAKGSITAAEEFAMLARHAADLLAHPAPRILVRRPGVTEALMERDA